jgi:hypothetical protein
MPVLMWTELAVLGLSGPCRQRNADTCRKQHSRAHDLASGSKLSRTIGSNSLPLTL